MSLGYKYTKSAIVESIYIYIYIYIYRLEINMLNL